jgi:hypothetical protein
MTADDDIADELLLRETYEVTLNVDLATARNMDDVSLARVLGWACVRAVREFIADEDA